MALKPLCGQRNRLLVLIAALAATIVACASDDEPSGARSSPPQSSLTDSSQVVGPVSPSLPASPIAPSATLSPTARTAALDAYRQMWAAMMQAASVPDPALPALARFASGEALSKLQYSLTVDLQNGFVTRGPLRITPQVASESGGVFRIADCVDDSEALKYRSDGSLKDDIPGGRRQVEAAVTQVAGEWKVTELHVRETGTC